jgi:hypothetical protein
MSGDDTRGLGHRKRSDPPPLHTTHGWVTSCMITPKKGVPTPLFSHDLFYACSYLFPIRGMIIIIRSSSDERGAPFFVAILSLFFINDIYQYQEFNFKSSKI